MPSLSPARRGSLLSAAMGSLAEKLEKKALHTCRDISLHLGNLDFHLSKVQSHRALILNQLGVLQLILSDIAVNRAIHGNMVSARLAEAEQLRTETRWPPSSPLPSTPGSPASVLSDRATQGSGLSPDISCYETVLRPEDLVTDQMLDADGFLEYPEWERVGGHMRSSRRVYQRAHDEVVDGI